MSPNNAGKEAEGSTFPYAGVLGEMLRGWPLSHQKVLPKVRLPQKQTFKQEFGSK